MRIRTALLQDMVAKAVKGASLNRLLPLTSMIEISNEDGLLTLTTTDMNNYLYIQEEIEDEQDFEIVIGVEKFAKLISRLNCEFVELELLEKELKVITNNGSYSIEIPVDENGKPVQFPFKQISGGAKRGEIKLATVKNILKVCKPALAVTLESPCYTNYYTGDKIMATDTYKIAAFDDKFMDDPALISAETMSLLDIMDSDIIYEESENEIVFQTDNCSVYTTKANGIEDYAYSAINSLVDSEFDYFCKVQKNKLISALERVSLFIGLYDNNAVELTFDAEYLTVTNKESSATETVELEQGDEKFKCLIDAEMFLTQIKANDADVLEIWYGKENSIKIENERITQVLCLLDK